MKNIKLFLWTNYQLIRLNGVKILNILYRNHYTPSFLFIIIVQDFQKVPVFAST